MPPARMLWPAYTFTPRCFGFESRPLRLEPWPFLCAMDRSPSNFEAEYKKESPRAATRGLFILTKIPGSAKGCHLTRERRQRWYARWSFYFSLPGAFAGALSGGGEPAR